MTYTSNYFQLLLSLMSERPPQSDRTGESLTTEEVQLDRSKKSGASSWVENTMDEESWGTSNDGRSDTSTTFYYWESNDRGRNKHQLHRRPRDRSGWSRLSTLNDGVGEPNRAQKNFEADVRRWARTFAGQLDVTPYQKERTEYVIEHVDLELFGPYRFSSEMVILGILSLVVDKETADIDNWIVYRDDFEGLMDDIGMDRSDLWTIRQILKEQTDQFE